MVEQAWWAEWHFLLIAWFITWAIETLPVEMSNTLLTQGLQPNLLGYSAPALWHCFRLPYWPCTAETRCVLTLGIYMLGSVHLQWQLLTKVAVKVRRCSFPFVCVWGPLWFSMKSGSRFRWLQQLCDWERIHHIDQASIFMVLFLAKDCMHLSFTGHCSLCRFLRAWWSLSRKWRSLERSKERKDYYKTRLWYLDIGDLTVVQ